MAPPKKIPLESSNNNKIPSSQEDISAPTEGKTIEEMYEKKIRVEDILLRPDTYIGSMEKHDQNLWVYELLDDLIYKKVSYVPGLYQIFDEILVNAAHNKQRDPNMDRLKVEIDQKENLISVYNTGDGIPVEMHKEEGVYIPELIFGHLLTSTSYNNDQEKKITAGYGAKLTNIFSTRFVIEIADAKRQLKYKQVFTDNMGQKGEPEIKEWYASGSWTKVTFHPDLAKFNMIHLENDVVALMKKRVVDMAGCLASCPGKKVVVFLNGRKIKVKSFHDYAQLYLNTANSNRENPLPRIDNNTKEDTNPRWQITVSQSDGQFQQVSFVNSINTIKGGTHVDYITNQITKYVMEAVKKKNKNANLTQHNVKNYLWVFVNALIDSPAFDSQTKETLTTHANSFGTSCELSDNFLKRVVDGSGVVESLLSCADFKLTRRILDVPKLDVPKLKDANKAGGSKSHQCTLILTEGHWGEALAMVGLSVVGQDYYGVFSLRGKLLNVRDASPKEIFEDAEIDNLTKILGLKHGEKYDKEGSVKSLRYGHLMIMANQGHDGSRIKGLIINFIHTFWPSLLRSPSFMLEFITPIVKDKEFTPFYTMHDYGDCLGWTVKYYKVLGASEVNEAKKYFGNLQRHRKVFVWHDKQDGDAIELAFSKEKIEARKDWLREEEAGSVLDHNEEFIKYSDFVHKELKLFFRADLQSSIPSMVDGFKPTQRKVLFTAFKINLVDLISVRKFIGYVMEKSAYRHGGKSIQTTIVGMAQNFVGTNNINLLMPHGQFGTRILGGKDAATPMYMFTRLAGITRFLFPKLDDVLLNYLNEDGLIVEPTWYLPVIPMVLVNGSEGIGTGWSTFIPSYNPRDIIANIKHLLEGEPLEPMDPWYNKFKGTIQKSASEETGVTYTVTGTIEIIGEDDDEEASGTDVTLKITELPIRKWTQDYQEFLSSLLTPANKNKEGFIKTMKASCTHDNACFEVTLSRTNFNLAKREGLLKKFKLTNTLSTSNMHLFDEDNKITRYESPEQILEKFFQLRLQYYKKRKEKYIEIYELELLKLDNQARFILAAMEGKWLGEWVDKLQDFASIPKTAQQDNSEHNAQISGYDYLTNMALGDFTDEKVKDLRSNMERVQMQIEELKKHTEKTLWLKDLEDLEKALDENDKKEKEKAEDQKGKRPVVESHEEDENSPDLRLVVIPNNSAVETEVTEAAATKKGSQQAAAKPLAVEDISDDDDSQDVSETVTVPEAGKKGRGRTVKTKEPKQIAAVKKRRRATEKSQTESTSLGVTKRNAVTKRICRTRRWPAHIFIEQRQE